MIVKKQKGPLEGLVILDLTRVLAGPYCTMILSDLGARVIKVESPNGDDSRKFGPFKLSISTYFLSLNRGKESIKLNLKEQKDMLIFKKMLSNIDVLVENFRPGTMEKLGLGYKSLSKKYPKLIYASCSGFGSTGPWSKKPAYDVIVQALGGIMSLTGHEGDDPVRVGSSIGDITAGLFTVIGILSAIINRKNTNKGSFIDISMLDCQIAILENAIARYFSDKHIPKKLGSRHPSISPFECYKCKNDYIVIAAGNDSLFKKLCSAINAKKIEKNGLFQSNDLRLNNADKLKKQIESILSTKSTNYWIKRFEKYGVPVGKVNNIKEALSLEQVKARNMLVSVNLNKKNKLKIAGNPIKISSFNDPKVRKRAPLLDQHRSSILKDFKIKE